MIVDNGAADIGGAIMLDDSSNVRIINNTVANNVTTGSSENSAIGVPHSAGPGVRGATTRCSRRCATRAVPDAATADFSNPTALFNNIFWNNNAFTLDQFGPGATLVDQGFIDFEVHGTTNNADTLHPALLRPDQRPDPRAERGAARGARRPGEHIGADPAFVTPFMLELTVSGSRLDPQTAAVTITGADPPVGLTGDYHLAAGSPVIDRGVALLEHAVPAPPAQRRRHGRRAPGADRHRGRPTRPDRCGDYDGQYRPQLRDAPASARRGTSAPTSCRRTLLP